MRILIAEDNQPLQALAEDLMSIWNFDFDMANNGQEAVEFAQKNEVEYDICLMDVEMPIMNGVRKGTQFFL